MEGFHGTTIFDVAQDASQVASAVHSDRFYRHNVSNDDLILSQTTNFTLFQAERVSRRQF